MILKTVFGGIITSFNDIKVHKIKSRLPDLNQQHSDLQSDALPIELRRDTNLFYYILFVL